MATIWHIRSQLHSEHDRQCMWYIVRCVLHASGHSMPKACIVPTVCRTADRLSMPVDSYPGSTPVRTKLCACRHLGRAADLQVGAAQPHRRGPPACASVATCEKAYSSGATLVPVACCLLNCSKRNSAPMRLANAGRLGTHRRLT